MSTIEIIGFCSQEASGIPRKVAGKKQLRFLESFVSSEFEL